MERNVVIKTFVQEHVQESIERECVCVCLYACVDELVSIPLMNHH